MYGGYIWMGTRTLPDATPRGASTNNLLVSIGRTKLSTDPSGSFTLTLKNIVRGSRYRIERAGDGSLATPTANAEGEVAAGAGTTIDLSITLDYYASGSANNDLVIKVRKGTSGTKYLPFETQATAASGTAISYISQSQDTIVA
jgi:hypothetical protein